MARTGKELIKEEIQSVDRDIEETTGNIALFEAQLDTLRQHLTTITTVKAALESDKTKLEKV